MAERSTPALTCPECRLDGRGGDARIGNRRTECGTCNRWHAAVSRAVLQRLKKNHLKEYERLRVEVEVDLYPGVMQKFQEANGLTPTVGA